MHIREETRKTREVRDLNSAAYLLLSDYELLGVSWSGRVAWWRFADHDNQIEERIREFVNGRAEGNLADFTRAQQTLKQSLREN